MTKASLPLSALLYFLLAASVDAGAAGTLNRAYVSAATGTLGNPCTQALPCRTINEAVPKVIAGGEVLLLDSGGYGQLLNNTLGTITQSVTIVVPQGVFGALSVPATGATSGLVINAPGATVTLRGLTISSQGGSNVVGVDIVAADQVNIENCAISNFIGQGNAGVISRSGAAVSMNVINSTFRNNTDSISTLRPAPTMGVRTMVVSNTDILFDASATDPTNPSVGIQTTDSTNATVSNSRLVGLAYAIEADSSTTSAPINMTVENTLVSGTIGTSFFVPEAGTVNAVLSGNSFVNSPQGTALSFNGSGALWLSGNRISNNASLCVIGSGTVFTYGNNIFTNNSLTCGAFTAATGN